MPEWMNSLLASIGGGAIVLVGFFAVFKSFILKLIDSAVETSFEKTTIKLSNMLDRKMKAYEILLGKEFEFYEKLDSYKAELVPLVQDFRYLISDSRIIDETAAMESYKKQFTRYLEIIPEIKSISLLYQPYIPSNVFSAAADLVVNMQSGLRYLSHVGESLFKKTDDIIDENKVKEIEDKVLMSIAVLERFTKDRLTELSNG